MWKLKDQAEGGTKSENAVKAKELLEGLNGKIPGLLHLEVGFDFSRTATSADLILYSEFDSRESLDGYQVHPEHQRVAKFVGQIRGERRMVDYEV
jgi:hypothetical protein